MPITFEQVKTDSRFKEKLDSFQAKRLKRLESEYQDLFLTGSREDGSTVFRTKNGTIISVDSDLDLYGVDSTDQLVPVNLEKTSPESDKVDDIVDKNFKELMGGAGLGLSIEELFNEYERLKGSIPGEGTINSHRYLVETSVEYIGGMDELARIKAELERELKELESLIAETAEKEAAWTSYLAEMNNFVDTTQPYSRADWEQKGNPIASADAGYQKLRFVKNLPYSVATTPKVDVTGVLELPYRVSKRTQRRKNGKLSSGWKKIYIKVDAVGGTGMTYRWFVDGNEIFPSDRYGATDKEVVEYFPAKYRKNHATRVFTCKISDSQTQGEITSGPIKVQVD
jgi:hypothetical protein|tara:strand:+ start:557 stop:1579 length:1023 start_codon:yes stop_codon:yes gene_type:complete